MPEPFELTVAPHRYAIVDLHEPDLEATEDAPTRIPDGVGHSIIVRSLNGVPVTAEQVLTLSEPQQQPRRRRHPRRAAGRARPGSSRAAASPTSATSTSRCSTRPRTRSCRVDVSALVDGERPRDADLQDLEIPPVGARTIRMSDHVDLETLPLVVTADGPIVVERGLFRSTGAASRCRWASRRRGRARARPRRQLIRRAPDR